LKSLTNVEIDDVFGKRILPSRTIISHAAKSIIYKLTTETYTGKPIHYILLTQPSMKNLSYFHILAYPISNYQN